MWYQSLVTIMTMECQITVCYVIVMVKEHSQSLSTRIMIIYTQSLQETVRMWLSNGDTICYTFLIFKIEWPID